MYVKEGICMLSSKIKKKKSQKESTHCVTSQIPDGIAVRRNNTDYE